MSKWKRSAVLVGATVALTGGVVFLVVSQATSQEPRNREIGLSDEQRMTAHAGGVPTSIAVREQRIREFLALAKSVDDTPLTYGKPELVSLRYTTLEELTTDVNVDAIVTGVVQAQRFEATYAPISQLYIVSTVVVTTTRKGGEFAQVELATPIGLSGDSPDEFALSASDQLPVPKIGSDVVLFLRTSVESTALHRPLPFGTYEVDPAGKIVIPSGGDDGLNAGNVDRSGFLARIDAALATLSTEQ